MSAGTIRAGAPPGQKDERPTGHGEAFEKRMGLGTRDDHSTNRIRWAAYAARRRLRRRRAGCRWPSEVVS